MARPSPGALMATMDPKSENDSAVKGILFVLSLTLGLGASYIFFLLFLQTPVISYSRLTLIGGLFVLFTCLHYLCCKKWLIGKLKTAGSQKPKTILICLILPALFLPLFYEPPAYPRSPLLRPWTELAIQFKLPIDSGPARFPEGSVRLVVGKVIIDTQAFQLIGDWQSADGALILPPGSTAALGWAGPAAQTTTLTIFPPSAHGELTIYWDGSRTTFELDKDAQAPIKLVKKFSLPWGPNLVLFLSLYLLTSWGAVLTFILFERPFKYLERLEKPRVIFWSMIFIAGFLAILTVKMQIQSLAGGLGYLSNVQLARHFAVLEGQSFDPWQYRIFAEVIAEIITRLYQFVSVQTAYIPAFISLRLLQNAAIFLIAFSLYKKISGSNILALLGILLLAGSMKNAFYDNDLSFNTYFDVIFYLLTALLLLARNYYGVMVIMPFAALNRETSGLIPFLMLATALYDGQSLSKKITPVWLSAAIFALIFGGLRILIPDRPLYIPYKHPPGSSLLLYNLTREFTWHQLFKTLGIIPILDLAFLFSWPRLWQWFFFVLCPIWFGIHFFASVVGETRLFLVPQALIFIPGVLFLMNYLLDSQKQVL